MKMVINISIMTILNISTLQKYNPEMSTLPQNLVLQKIKTTAVRTKLICSQHEIYKIKS